MVIGHQIIVTTLIFSAIIVMIQKETELIMVLGSQGIISSITLIMMITSMKNFKTT